MNLLVLGRKCLFGLGQFPEHLNQPRCVHNAALSISLCLSRSLSLSLSLSLSVSVSLCVSLVSLSLSLSVSLCLSFCVSLCLCLSVCLSVCLCLSVSVCLSVSLCLPTVYLTAFTQIFQLTLLSIQLGTHILRLALSPSLPPPPLRTQTTHARTHARTPTPPQLSFVRQIRDLLCYTLPWVTKERLNS